MREGGGKCLRAPFAFLFCLSLSHALSLSLSRSLSTVSLPIRPQNFSCSHISADVLCLRAVLTTGLRADLGRTRRLQAMQFLPQTSRLLIARQRRLWPSFQGSC